MELGWDWDTHAWLDGKWFYQSLKCLPFYGSECWTIFSQMRKLEAAKIWFHRRITKIPWTEWVSNKEVFEKMAIERTLLLRIRKKTAGIPWTNEESELGKLNLTSLCEWIVESWVGSLAKGEKLQWATRDKKLWRAMIAHVLKGQGTWKKSIKIYKVRPLKYPQSDRKEISIPWGHKPYIRKELQTMYHDG